MSISSHGRVVGVVAAAFLIAGCAGSAATGSSATFGASPSSQPSPGLPTGTPGAALSATPATPDDTASASASAGPAAGLIVLVGGDVPALWAYSPGGGWSSQARTPGATVIAAAPGGVLLASVRGTEVRGVEDLTTVAQSVALQWPAGLSATSLLSVDVAVSGDLALAAEIDGKVEYATAAPSGVVSDVDPAPQLPFAPVIAWLNDGRRLVLQPDNLQQSRLAVTGGPGKYTSLSPLIGCRWFAVSGDGQTAAVATAGALWIAPTSTVVASGQEQQIDSIADGSIVWDLALDRAGTRLAMLTGEVAADGAVPKPHEVVYELTGSSWQKTLDVAVPFTNTLGQAWAG